MLESALAELDATLAQVKKDRDEEWTRLKTALAAMTADRIKWQEAAAKAAEKALGAREELEMCLNVLHIAREVAADYEGKLHTAEAKLEAVEAIVAQAITDPYLIAHLEAALATTGLSVRQRVEKVLALWVDKEKMLSAVMDGWLRVNPHLTCQSMRADLERALKGEA